MTKPLKVAHRGWHSHHVENTLEAFRAAYAAGCDMVEFDVQLSRDGVPVIFHDDDCQRLAHRPEPLHTLVWEEIRRIRMPRHSSGPGGPGGAAYAIPSLKEFLKEFSSRPYYLELKVPRAMESDQRYIELLGATAASLVRDADPHPQTFLASFHGGILRFLHSRGLYPVLGGIFEDYARFQEVLTARDVAIAAAVRYYSISWKLFRRYLKDGDGKAPGADRFLVWDISASHFQAAAKAGLYGIVADDVDTLVLL